MYNRGLDMKLLELVVSEVGLEDRRCKPTCIGEPSTNYAIARLLD